MVGVGFWGRFILFYSILIFYFHNVTNLCRSLFLIFITSIYFFNFNHIHLFDFFDFYRIYFIFIYLSPLDFYLFIPYSLMI